MDKINIAEKLGQIDQHWFPAQIARVDNYDVKVVKLEGEFVWHQHDDEDEMFFVVEGAFEMHFRDKVVEIDTGEMIVVPKGTEHKPVAHKECSVVLFEKQGVVNTGDAAAHDLTRATLPRI